MTSSDKKKVALDLKTFWDQIDRDYFQEISLDQSLPFIDRLTIQIDQQQLLLTPDKPTQISAASTKKPTTMLKSQTPRPSHLSVFQSSTNNLQKSHKIPQLNLISEKNLKPQGKFSVGIPHSHNHMQNIDQLPNQQDQESIFGIDGVGFLRGYKQIMDRYDIPTRQPDIDEEKLSETQIQLRELKMLEEIKKQIGMFLNYSLYKTTRELPAQKKFKEPVVKISIDEELAKLQGEYEESNKEARMNLKRLRKAIQKYEDPDSVVILRERIDNEREYLQRTIIQMELKQLAESISMISFKKRIRQEEIGMYYNNRPILWAQRILHQEEINQRKQRKLGWLQRNKENVDDSIKNEWEVSTNYIYDLRFDPSLLIPETWVDGKIMNQFNAQRDNIFASSSKYDIVQLRQGTAHYHTTSENTNIDQIEKQSRMQRNRQNLSSKKRSKSTPGPKIEPVVQSKNIIEEMKSFDEDKINYGFCHHCKQLKNRFVLASCNYNSAKMGPTVPASYTVKDVKIYNSKYHSYQSQNILVDIGNKASYNYLFKQHMNKNHKGGINTPFLLSEINDPTVKAGHLQASSGRSRLNSECLKGDDDNYICSRKFCSFCLKTQYELIFGDCYKNPEWICPFCQGICFCTRCLRQDTMTQLKAYFIALGGDLDILQTSDCIFDKTILNNFQTHLQLTLLANPELIIKYQHYQDFISHQGYGQNRKYQNETLNQLANQNTLSQFKPLHFPYPEPKLGFTQEIQSFDYKQNPEKDQNEGEKEKFLKLFEYCILQINEEEKEREKRRKLSNQTYLSIKKKDEEIINILKKPRGRKRFILIDNQVKERLSKKDAKYLEEVTLHHQPMLIASTSKTNKIETSKDNKILKEISNKLEQIQKLEEKIINKDRIQSLAEQSQLKEKKRRRTTHFTPSKTKKKKSLVFRKQKPMLGFKSKKSTSKALMKSKLNSSSASQKLTPCQSQIQTDKTSSISKKAPIRIEKVRVSSGSKSIQKPKLKQTQLKFQKAPKHIR
ncbi:UNKNOWN [Stylonychia lemnae]|uniref:Zinc-finger domain-containing protein n=1 Tax=Stylonychia lemnae TaxID=5949 RepID=A0A078AX81_STYLE|nr:UNKNOWN [Stylonychia lemnae]|eukprot:CDW86779.1 UNKNOWN [Stylonychia lemnae]